MPHECVSCGHVLEDGSDEVLDGCPDCAGTTFAYVAGTSDSPGNTPGSSEEPNKDDTDILEADSGRQTGLGAKPDDGTVEERPPEEKNPEETPQSPPSTETSAAEEARRELMDQFETIRIVEPGSYELNLMNLYEEDQKIIALQEDGRYQVSLPTGFDE